METQLEHMSDDEVLATAALQLPEDQQIELSDLLAEQREGELTEAGRIRLDALMQMYREGMVRKSQALKMAVERGLMPRLG